uniref:Uncharacterized protein n=1 Tax=Oryza sativa subsp. indica TaxID=39946 RepID=C5NNV8_ORYSI|nr:hypothetical protein [Oryza sativa Indica Group]
MRAAGGTAPDPRRLLLARGAGGAALGRLLLFVVVGRGGADSARASRGSGREPSAAALVGRGRSARRRTAWCHWPRPPPSAQPAEPLGAAVCTHRLPCPPLLSSPLLDPKAAKRPKPEEKEKAVWPAGRELDTSPSGRGVLLSTRKNEQEDNGEYLTERVHQLGNVSLAAPRQLFVGKRSQAPHCARVELSHRVTPTTAGTATVGLRERERERRRQIRDGDDRIRPPHATTGGDA